MSDITLILAVYKPAFVLYKDVDYSEYYYLRNYTVEYTGRRIRRDLSHATSISRSLSPYQLHHRCSHAALPTNADLVAFVADIHGTASKIANADM